jgi:hypothetical protein
MIFSDKVRALGRVNEVYSEHFIREWGGVEGHSLPSLWPNYQFLLRGTFASSVFRFVFFPALV